MKFPIGMGISLNNMAMSNPDPGNLYTWVATTGNDTTGDGTYRNPYATLYKAHSLTLTGTKATIYVRSGTYSETYFRLTKAYTWIAYGGTVTLKASDTNYVVYASGTATASMNGFTIDREGVNSYSVFFFNSTTTNKTFTNCTFINPHATKQHVMIPTTCDALTFSGCTFNGNCVNAIYFNNNANTNSFAITNCTFNGTHTNTLHFYATGTAVTTVTLSGNTFNYAGGRGIYIQKRVVINGSNNTVNYVGDVTASSFAEIYTSGTYTGTFKFNDSVINFNSYSWGTNESYAVFSFGGANNAIDFEFCNNVISGTNVSAKNAILYYSDQASFKVNNNIVDLHYTTALREVFDFQQPTKDNTGVAECKNNLIKARMSYNALGFGNDASGTGDNRIKNLIVEGNVLYLNRYYDNAYTYAQHSIFFGFQTGYICRYNTVYGGGYGIVCKHDNEHAMATGGVFYNTFIDCNTAIYDKGLSDLLIYGNTVINTLTQNNSLVVVQRNADIGGVADISGCKLRNNIVYSAIATNKALIAIGAAGNATSDYNMLNTASAYACTEASTNYTFANWQALGYDTNSVYDTPELNNIASMETADVNPKIDSNVIGVGENLGADYMIGIGSTSSGTAIVSAYQHLLWDMGSHITNGLIPPVAIAGEALSDTDVLANWNEVSDKGLTAYRVDLSTHADFSDYVVDDLAVIPPAESQIFNELTAETTYYYRVRSVINGITSSHSNIISVTTLPIP